MPNTNNHISAPATIDKTSKCYTTNKMIVIIVTIIGILSFTFYSYTKIDRYKEAAEKTAEAIERTKKEFDKNKKEDEVVLPPGSDSCTICHEVAPEGKLSHQGEKTATKSYNKVKKQ